MKPVNWLSSKLIQNYLPNTPIAHTRFGRQHLFTLDPSLSSYSLVNMLGVPHAAAHYRGLWAYIGRAVTTRSQKRGFLTGTPLARVPNVPLASASFSGELRQAVPSLTQGLLYLKRAMPLAVGSHYDLGGDALLKRFYVGYHPDRFPTFGL